MGDFDLTSQIDYVLKQTGQRKLTYMGHSQGTTQMFYSMATNEKWLKERVNLFIALAPAVYIKNSRIANLFSFLAKFEWFLEPRLAE